MCELMVEGSALDEPAAARTTRAWYGYVGTTDSFLTPTLCDSKEIAEAEVILHNHKYPSLGPWSVVELRERLSP